MKALLTAFAFLLIGIQVHASSVDRQIRSNTEALKKTQQEMKRAEAKVKELEVRETGVLQTIAEIDNGLTRTREQLDALQQRERVLKQAIEGIEKEIQALQKSIDTQKEAIASRLRSSYIHGKREEWELLLNLLNENENPERKFYWVQRLLKSDKVVIENYLASIAQQQEKKQALGVKQKELFVLHENQAREESKLQNQLIFQNEVLTKVKRDKTTQERAIAEYKRNQQTLSTLIATLERRRQAEIAARRKAEEEKRRAATKQAPARGRVALPKEAPVAVGPKCTPLKGQILSDFGYHVNRDLNIRIMHLGTEIRGQKGEGVKAAATGTVVMVGNIPGHGPSVILDHKGSYYSVYGHLANIKVKEGEQIKNCQEIGTVGNTESTNGYKLFFQIYKGTQAQDPMAWLKK
ncbi:MAG: peptidoglycan DD-metalloendopeptidase family protein [Fibromonadaceae bacterium]|nr:peptidoglycan DD-metalloendopeptidase family protein [Fibromonadaceae bacterium]